MLRRSYQPAVITLLLATFPFVLLSVSDKKAALHDLAFVLPYLVAALIGFLSLKLNQHRPFLLALYLAGVYALLQTAGPAAKLGLPAGALARAIAVAMPLTFLGIFLAPERSRGTGWLIRLGAVLGPTLLVIGVVELAGPELVAPATGIALVTGLPQAAFFFAAAFAASTALTHDRFLRDFRVFTTLALAPLFYVMSHAPSALHTALGFLSAGTILVYAIFRLYWQKVYVDELTGIPNRRALNERLLHLKKRYAIAMTDIDFFKRFNDTYGHDEGDNVLRFVAKHLDKESGGNAYRYGGEEICVVLEGKSALAATKLMEKMRQKLAAREFHIRAPKPVREMTSEKDRDKAKRPRELVSVTLSVGVAGYGDSLRRPEDVLIAADAALYRAKELGRDRVLMAQIGTPAPEGPRQKASRT